MPSRSDKTPAQLELLRAEREKLERQFITVLRQLWPDAPEPQREFTFE